MTKLMSLIQNNEDYSKRLNEVKEKVKKDKQKVLNIAEEYNQKYKDQIEEGTRRKQLLLSEGERKGMSDEEMDGLLSKEGFIPTVQTPILNWLFYFMVEDKRSGITDSKRQKLNEQVGHLTHEEVKVMEKSPEMFEYLFDNLTLKEFRVLKKLKALSRSDNEHEAFNAYKKCLVLCEKHNVDFDRIPLEE